MKKLLTITAVMAFLIAAGTADAELTGKKIDIGPKIGMNVATLSGDNMDDATAKVGLVLGGALSVNFSDMFALQPEVLFSMKGSSFDVANNRSYRLNYLEIPILGRVNIPLKGVTPFFVIGPAFGINVSSTWTTDNDNGDLVNVSPMDVGLVIGGGAAIPVGKGKVVGELRFEKGLKTIDDTATPDTITNSVFSILVGYAF
jgi:hypothetical protein